MSATPTTLPLLGFRSTASGPQSKIKVDNAISECVRVVADEPRPQKNLLLVSARMDVIKSISGIADASRGPFGIERTRHTRADSGK